MKEIDRHLFNVHRVYLVHLPISTITDQKQFTQCPPALHVQNDLFSRVFCKVRKERKRISQYRWKLFYHETNVIHQYIHPFPIRKQQNYIVRCIIYSENLEDLTKHQFINRPRKLPVPSFQGPFLGNEINLNQILHTFKHQLDNLKFSFSFIKYSCFERQSECKNVNVIKQVTGLETFYCNSLYVLLLYSLLGMNLLVGLKQNICLLSWKIPLKN